jgi:nucleoporin GLE1
MTGIIAFYFAVCQTAPSAPPGSTSFDAKKIPEHFRTRALWVWQARSMSPRILNQSLSPALWSALIEVAGPSLLGTYGKQTVKVWRLMLEEGLGEEKAAFCKLSDANSAKVRLKQLLQDWSKSGQVQGATSGREMVP